MINSTSYLNNADVKRTLFRLNIHLPFALYAQLPMVITYTIKNKVLTAPDIEYCVFRDIVVVLVALVFFVFVFLEVETLETFSGEMMNRGSRGGGGKSGFSRSGDTGRH